MAVRVVAFLPRYPPYSLVGSWVTTHEYLAHLVTLGHRCDVIATESTAFPYVHEGVHVHPQSTRPGPIMGEADVVVTHVGDRPTGARWAQKAKVPLVRLAHSEPSLRSTSLDAPVPPDLVIYNSQATADAWDDDRFPSAVVHPPIRPDRYLAVPGDRMTLVNLSVDKGGGTFWQLARTMTDLPFLGVVGGHGVQVLPGDAAVAVFLGRTVEATSNVAVMPPQLDMRHVYARTRVLLMPSVRESYGRVALEAACSGIPTIAHPTPGLIEALGPAGIYVDREDLDGWEDEIRRLADPDEWAEASSAASMLVTDDPTPALNRCAALILDAAGAFSGCA